MKTHQTGFILSALVAMSVVCFSQAANAGGLFGEGGLIRGDVGNWVDRNVEQPYLTPAARNATVGVTTGVGTVVGGAIGGPGGARVGAYGGKYVGDTINERLAGQSPPIGRPYQYQQSQPPSGQYYQQQPQQQLPVMYPAPQYQPMGYAYQPPPVRLGRLCVAPNGLSGVANLLYPLGTFCQIATPSGMMFAGQIIQ